MSKYDTKPLKKQSQTPTVQSRVLKTRSIDWTRLEFLQKPDFKEWIDSGDEKLCNSLIRYQFIDPFKVWENRGKLYCLDGYHRVQDLKKLQERGINVPAKLPAIFIDCADMKEAAELVLIYSSSYARTTEKGFASFMQEFQLDPMEMSHLIAIPEFNHMTLPDSPTNSFDDEGIMVKNQFGIIVMCDDEGDQQKVFDDLTRSGYTCKIVVT